MEPRSLLWILITSLFLSQMDVFHSHFTELSSTPDITDRSLRERERERERERACKVGGAKRKGERSSSRLCTGHGACLETQSYNPEITIQAETKSLSLNHCTTEVSLNLNLLWWTMNLSDFYPGGRHRLIILVRKLTCLLSQRESLSFQFVCLIVNP